MGNLQIFDIKEIKNKYDLGVFVETGSFKGDTLFYMLKFRFYALFSVEYLKHYYEMCKKRFEINPRINLLHGKSYECLPAMLKYANQYNENILFWLDAHLASIYDKKEHADDVQFPLQLELKAILESRDVIGDYFIIDDLRIYENGDFENGNCPERHKCAENNLMYFIWDNFSKTHHIEKLYRKEGYIILKPKNLP